MAIATTPNLEAMRGGGCKFRLGRSPQGTTNEQRNLNTLDQAIKRAKKARADFMESYNLTMKSLYQALEDAGEVETQLVHLSGDSAWLITSELWDDHHHAPISISTVMVTQQVPEEEDPV